MQNLRRIHAETGEKILDILDRLVADEWQRVKHENAEIQTVQKRKESAPASPD